MVINKPVYASSRLNFNTPKPTAPKTTQPKPTASAPIASHTMKEIQRKAENGIQMSSPTADKQKIYDNFANFYKNETIKKAQSGTALQRPNAWKNDIYNQNLVKTPETPTAPAFDMEQFTGMFDGYNEQNNTRFSALEKMIQEMMNGQKYNQAQQGQQAVGGTNAVYDGTHQFTAPTQGANVGYTQNNDAMNQTLYKYLNGMWKGGF